MYNQILNDKFENRFIGYCMGKRVLVVGNSLSLFANNYGDFIDSFDVVIRLGKGYPWPEFREHLGTKTDAWVLSILRCVHYKEFKDAPFKILNMAQMSVYNRMTENTSISKLFFSPEFQIYRDYFLIGNLDRVRTLVKLAYGKIEKNQRMSQGAITISWLVNIIRKYSELHLIGFDFFESKMLYELQGQLNEVSSYHMPVPLNKGVNTNPHNGLYANENLDKQYILRLRDEGKLILHPMENLQPSPEKLDMLMKKFRHDGVIINEQPN